MRVVLRENVWRLSRPFFFFSSRRRHTRWPRDWSSDVCSSDLMSIEADQQRVAVQRFYGHVACVEFLNIAFAIAARLREEFAAPVLVHVERDEIEEIGRASCRARVEGWSEAGYTTDVRKAQRSG